MRFRRGRVIKVLDGRTVKVRSDYYFKWPKLGKQVRYKKDLLVHVGEGSSFVEGEEVSLKQIAKVSKRKAHLALKRS